MTRRWGPVRLHLYVRRHDAPPPPLVWALTEDIRAAWGTPDTRWHRFWRSVYRVLGS